MKLAVPLSCLALLGALVACDGPTDATDDGIDLDAIFEPASASETAEIEQEWDERTPAALDVVQVMSVPFQMGGVEASARVVSHSVDGFRHFGAIIVPADAPARGLPVVLFAHPGDEGISLLEVTFLLGVFGEWASNFIWVVPSFRSEALTVGSTHFTSGGPASPWDRDVDDALALLDVALDEVPEADSTRIGVLGVSRGAGVALLLAIREPRVDRVIEFSGPTDFYGPYVREIVEEAMEGEPRNLPGLDALNDLFIQPLLEGTMSIEDFRRELTRRSAVLFADRLPAVQVHHGTDDEIVEVSQAMSLQSAVEELERPGLVDEFYLYEGVGHDPFDMIQAPARVMAFLAPLLAQ